MKTTIFANRGFTFSATLVTTALALSLAQSALSQSLITDNFQSCTDDASLLTTWTRVSGTDASIFLAPDPMDPANQTIQQTTAAGRLRQVFPGVIPTASAPLSLSFDLYDANGGTTSGRVFGEVRNSAAATGLFAAGIYNSATAGYDMTRYQARNLDNGGWIQLNTPRSVGWHNFRLEIANNTASLYIDNVVDPQFNGISYSGNVTYDWLHIGSGLTGNVGAYYDNVSLTVVPEPSTVLFGLLGLGTLFGFGWVRRR